MQFGSWYLSQKMNSFEYCHKISQKWWHHCLAWPPPPLSLFVTILLDPPPPLGWWHTFWMVPWISLPADTPTNKSLRNQIGQRCYHGFVRYIQIWIWLSNEKTVYIFTFIAPYDDKCGEKCDVRSGVCKDTNDRLMTKDACKAEQPCYPGCFKTCSDEPSADHCQGRSTIPRKYYCKYRQCEILFDIEKVSKQY